MTNVIPTLPREIANALELARKEGHDNFTIMHLVREAVFTEELLILKRYAFGGEHGGTPDLLMSALINGYTVEQTPEDKLREYYESQHRQWSHLVGEWNASTSATVEARMEGIKFALDTLGITIEGINA